MTADWCITCKMNERTVLKTERFAGLMAEHDMVVMQGDWTDVDPVISRFLDEYDSVGVPLYVVFRPGQKGRERSCRRCSPSASSSRHCRPLTSPTPLPAGGPAACRKDGRR